MDQRHQGISLASRKSVSSPHVNDSRFPCDRAGNKVSSALALHVGLRLRGGFDHAVLVDIAGVFRFILLHCLRLVVTITRLHEYIAAEAVQSLHCDLFIFFLHILQVACFFSCIVNCDTQHASFQYRVARPSHHLPFLCLHIRTRHIHHISRVHRRRPLPRVNPQHNKHLPPTAQRVESGMERDARRLCR